MTYETIHFDIQSNIGRITLNRPEKMNAFNDQMIEETLEAFRRCGRDDDVRCVVLTGSGRAFCAGGDVAAMRERPKGYSVGHHLQHTYHKLVRYMVGLEKPILGALNGVVAGAGVGIALATDVRIASDKASFVVAFKKVGLIPDCGSNWLLPRIIGHGRAYQLAVTAERVTAERALEWGMVSEVVAHEAFDAAVEQWATMLAMGPSLAFGLTKQAMMDGWEQPFDEALDYEAELQDRAGSSEDHQEGVRAFLEKRPPNFTGQ